MDPTCRCMLPTNLPTTQWWSRSPSFHLVWLFAIQWLIVSPSWWRSLEIYACLSSFHVYLLMIVSFGSQRKLLIRNQLLHGLTTRYCTFVLLCTGWLLHHHHLPVCIHYIHRHIQLINWTCKHEWDSKFLIVVACTCFRLYVFDLSLSVRSSPSFRTIYSSIGVTNWLTISVHKLVVDWC